MKVIIVSGFLGCGKTTLILTLGKELVRAGKSVAVIENDFGKVGVDPKVLRGAGLNVRDLIGGCICCTLGPDFLTGLKDLHTSIDPDIVIVEPSGIANPDTMLSSLEHYPGPRLEPAYVIALIDGPRFRSMLPAFEVPLRNQMKAANAVCISKSDLTTDAQVAEIRDWICSVRPGIKVISLGLPQLEGNGDPLLEVFA